MSHEGLGWRRGRRCCCAAWVLLQDTALRCAGGVPAIKLKLRAKLLYYAAPGLSLNKIGNEKDRTGTLGTKETRHNKLQGLGRPFSSPAWHFEIRLVHNCF